jgi:FixJ family two-component response regulator
LADEQEGQIDLLLSDLVMPEMSGADLAEQIATRIPDTRVLFMSGYADDAVTRNGTLKPGAAFIEKPFSRRDLAHKVRDVLDTHPFHGNGHAESAPATA